VVRRDLQRALVIRNRRDDRSLAAIGGIGDSAIPRSSRNSRRSGNAAIAPSSDLRYAASFDDRRRFFAAICKRARVDVTLDVITGFRRELLRARDRLPACAACSARCTRNSIQLREREIRIDSQRLVKRSRRFDPHVVVKVGEP
jgi:hypothetical protein